MGIDITGVLAIIGALFVWIALRRIRVLEARVSHLEALLAEPSPDAPQQADTQAVEAASPVAVQTSDKRKSRVPGSVSGLLGWLRGNWIYPVAGAALVMAAIYLVQYSIERGLLSPRARVGLALALGAALIGAAETLRRRWGQAATSPASVAATLAGAGIVALFAAVLAAFHLYAMLGQVMAFAWLAAVAVLAVALGWVHGAFLAALGILAGSAAPFLLGADAAPADLLYAYFGVVAFLGLGIDSLRRWGWVAGLAVLAPLAGAVLIRDAGAGPTGLALLVQAVVLLAMALPDGALMPRGRGPMAHQFRRARPEATTWIAAIAVVCGAAIDVLMLPAPQGIVATGLLAISVPLWSWRAPALNDLSLVAAMALPAAIGYSPIGTPLLRAFVLNVDPWMPLGAVLLATIAAALMLARALAGHTVFWVLLAVALPGATIVAAEVFWQPATFIAPMTWAATAMALAALYTAAALWGARRNLGQGLLTGAATAAAFTMIAFAMIVILSQTALTLALAVLLVGAAAMDRRFDLPPLGWFLGLATMTLGWRLVVDPGADWILDAQLSTTREVVLTLAAVLGGPLVALLVLAPMAPAKSRDWGRIITETGACGMVPVAVAIILVRFLDDAVSPHANLGIEGTTLIALSWVQAARARRIAGSRAMTLTRRALAVLFGALATLVLAFAIGPASPVFGGVWIRDNVVGWPLLNDLALAYGMPGAVLWLALRGRTGRGAVLGRGAVFVLGAVWIGCVIRHLWHQQTGMSIATGFRQGELYAYTVALLTAGAGALALVLRYRKRWYRFAGLALIGLAAAKAFLIDASGLTGLLRVGAFLGLGLSLAGLAWLNAWVASHEGSDRRIQ